MATYSDHEQRQLDQESGLALDRAAARVSRRNYIIEQQSRPHGVVDLAGQFDTEQQAHAAIADYERRWDPRGYGTKLGVERVRDKYFVFGHRYDSCD